MYIYFYRMVLTRRVEDDNQLELRTVNVRESTYDNITSKMNWFRTLVSIKHRMQVKALDFYGKFKL